MATERELITKTPMEMRQEQRMKQHQAAVARLDYLLIKISFESAEAASGLCLAGGGAIFLAPGNIFGLSRIYDALAGIGLPDTVWGVFFLFAGIAQIVLLFLDWHRSRFWLAFIHAGVYLFVWGSVLFSALVSWSSVIFFVLFLLNAWAVLRLNMVLQARKRVAE